MAITPSFPKNCTKESIPQLLYGDKDCLPDILDKRGKCEAFKDHDLRVMYGGLYRISNSHIRMDIRYGEFDFCVLWDDYRVRCRSS